VVKSGRDPVELFARGQRRQYFENTADIDLPLRRSLKLRLRHSAEALLAATPAPATAQARRLVRAEGFEPSRAYAQRIFVPATAFAAVNDVCGLDYTFTVASP
jgi:hypothetical protein